MTENAEAPNAAPIFILVEPQLAENIGSVARAMLNFGLTSLRLVSPRPLWPSDRAIQLAAGAESLLHQAMVTRSLREAVADCQVVYAASARRRDLVKNIVTPRQAAAEWRELAAQSIKTAILLGPERTGLVNDDVAVADKVVMVPLNPEFSSLNLAQAAGILAYEWFQAGESAPQAILRTGDSPPAERRQLLAFLDRLEHELILCGFLRNEHMRATMVNNLRALFARASLTDQELRSLHGVITELVTRRVSSP